MPVTIEQARVELQRREVVTPDEARVELTRRGVSFEQSIQDFDFSVEPTETVPDPQDINSPAIEPTEIPQIGPAPKRGFFEGGRAPLPPNADRIEKLDRAFDIVVGTPLRIGLKATKGVLFNLPDLAWAGIKKITPDSIWESDVKKMTLDQAMDWAAGNDPSGFEKLVGDIAEFAGRLKTAKAIGTKSGILAKDLPKGANILDKAFESAKLFGLGETGRQFQRFLSEQIDPETDYQYEGAKAVIVDMGLGAGLSLGNSLLVKPALARTAESGIGKAIIETYDRTMINISKKFPVIADTIRKNPSEQMTKLVDKQLKARGFDPKDFTPEQRAVANHMAREFEKRFVRAFKNFKPPEDIVKARVKPKLISGEVKPPTAIAPQPTVPTKPAIKPPTKAVARPEAEITPEKRPAKPEIERKPPISKEVTTEKPQEAVTDISKRIDIAFKQNDLDAMRDIVFEVEELPKTPETKELLKRARIVDGEMAIRMRKLLREKIQAQPPKGEVTAVKGQEAAKPTKITDSLDKLEGVEKTFFKDDTLSVFFDETVSKDAVNIRIQKELADKRLLDSVKTIKFLSTPKGTFEQAQPPKGKEQVKIQQAKNKAQATGKTKTIIKEGKRVDIVPDEDVSIVEDLGTLGAAETIPKIEASLEPKGKPVAARDVIFQMERDFGVPFRSKITHMFRKKIAHFQIRSKLIRSIDVRDLSTATHELGHHLDHNFFGLIHKHPPKGSTQELLDMGKELYGKRKPPGGYKSEGVAEYMRMWLTDNDAENRAPNFTKWFDKYLKDNPKVAKRLRRTRKLIEKWKAQGAVARIDSQIVRGKVVGGIKERIEDAIKKLDTLLLDRFAPLRRLRDEIGAEQLAPTEDPFVVATANATKSGGKAAFFALEGTTDLAGTINGISLQEALAPVSKDIKNWERWAVAAQARHWHGLGLNPGISKTDADFVFQQLKSPEFEKALDEFTKWQHRGLDYMVEAGAIEKSIVDAIKQKHPIHVPFKRAFKEGEIQQKFVPGRGFVETGSPIKKFKGSGRAIKDPIQEALLGMEAMISTAQKAQVSLAMANLADRFPGVGKHIVRIPAPQVPTTFRAEQIKGDIVKIAIQKLGANPVEANFAAWMDTWNTDLTVFTKGFRFTGKENVISIVRNDKRLFYEVSPDLFKTLKGLDKFTLPWYLDFWMGKANRALKLGATGVNPEFALRNFIRDLQTFGVTTEFAKGNFLSGIKGIGKDIKTDVSSIAEKFGVTIQKDEDVLRFRALGGELATFILQDKSGVKHLKSTVLASDGTKYVVNTFLHPIDVLRELVGITEVGTRIGEFSPALQEGERRYGKGTADAAMFALNAAQDVTVNFSKMGTLFQILNQTIPFSNVAVQGPVKLFQTFRKRPLRSIRRAIIGLTIPAVLLWWRNKDKKWWKQMPDHEKGNYLHIENPKDSNEIFRFPVAFELGHVFQTLPVTALDALYQNDPSDVIPMFEFALKQANPLDWPAAIGPIIDVKENKDFAGRPIVPRSVEGRLPEDRFTTRSTALMKFVGRKLKMSPAELDFLVNSYSGGLYGRTARLLTSTTEEPENKSDLPIIGTLFLRDPFAPRKQIERFYTRLELLSQKNQSKKITDTELKEFRIRNKIARAISPQWKVLRDAKTAKSRKKIYKKMENAINRGDKAIIRVSK